MRITFNVQRRGLRSACRRFIADKSRAQLIFDAQTKALQKARASLAPDAHKYDYLRDHMAAVVVDRLHDINRTFENGLDLFCGSAHVLRALRAAGEGKVKRLWHADVHEAVLRRARRHFDGEIGQAGRVFVFDERSRDVDVLARVGEGALDVVLSVGALHWVSDLPRVLALARRALRPDGVFVGAMLGGDTLHELRVSLQLAEEEARGRVAPRVSPMVRLRDVASLIAGAGFTLPTADTERVVVSFPHMHALLAHLRGMGETNALVHREIHCGRRIFQRASDIYRERFAHPSDNDGHGAADTRVSATFEIMHMIGWAPSAEQPRALNRGAADVSLADLAGTPP